MLIKIQDLNINYEVHGEGKDIVLLHGWGARIETMSPLIKYFSDSFKITAIDLPGFGKSDTPQAVWGTAQFAEIVKEFLQALKIDNPILMGHSHGGRIILFLTGNRLIKARKIVLIDSAGIKPKRKLKYYCKIYSFKLMKNFYKTILPKDKADIRIKKARERYGSADYKSSSGIMKDIMVKVVNEDFTDLLKKIDTSTLLIWGENDKDTPLSNGKLMERLIPDAGLVVLKNAGHYSYLDRPYEFNLIVSSFLENDK